MFNAAEPEISTGMFNFLSLESPHITHHNFLETFIKKNI